MEAVISYYCQVFLFNCGVDMKKIIINATAAKTSGALTILNDLIVFIESNPSTDKEYHLFTVLNEFNELKNIQVHKINTQNWISRVYWDNGGLQKLCRKNNLEPDAIISLQNTSTKYRNRDGLMIVQLVYYHQTIPLYPWNGLNYYSPVTLLYRYFYPFFVKLNNKKTHYVVQLPFIKDLFFKKFKNISDDRVSLVRPNDPIIDIKNIQKKGFPENKKQFRFLYPATLLNYKNHKILIDALALLKKNNPEILDNVAILFTVNQLSANLEKTVVSNKLESCIQLIGQIPYTELQSYYKSVDALLFPSKMESFGLPLLEASFFGLPVIAADLPYAREVLQNYSNAFFVDPDNADDWAQTISNYRKYNMMEINNTIQTENTWKDFIDLVDKLMLKQQ
jgi:glycosyltransferase involved in cell wall biosynthesis